MHFLEVNKFFKTRVSIILLIRNSSPSNILVGRSTNENLPTHISSSVNPYPQLIQAKSVTPCGHHGNGQELCQVCHQRAKRNIPVYLHEEKRTREAEDEKLLEDYLHNREVDEQKKKDVN